MWPTLSVPDFGRPLSGVKCPTGPDLVAEAVIREAQFFRVMSESMAMFLS